MPRPRRQRAVFISATARNILEHLAVLAAAQKSGGSIDIETKTKQRVVNTLLARGWIQQRACGRYHITGRGISAIRDDDTARVNEEAEDAKKTV